MLSIFQAADFLLPKKEYLEHWPVIACDQFTSQPDYWKQVKKIVGVHPSTYNIIYPEAEFGGDMNARIHNIQRMMNNYLKDGIFDEYKNSFIYVNRTLRDGSIRKGLVGVIDLEEYEFKPGSVSKIRATEQTVLERIPPRVKIRQGATLELSHVLLLCDDEKHRIFDTIESIKEKLLALYDFDLMQEGGHIAGWLITGMYAVLTDNLLNEYYCYEAQKFKDKAPLFFAVGDGNHSLATAKAHYEELKHSSHSQANVVNRARFSMVELENIHDDVQKFEPIHRIVSNVDVFDFLNKLQRNCCSDVGYPVQWVSGDRAGVIYMDKDKGVLPVSILQNALDHVFSKELVTNVYKNANIDYIHGEDTLRQLVTKSDTIGFILPPVTKECFFQAIASNGVLPRKTFSIGEAREKRYYMEARKL